MSKHSGVVKESLNNPSTPLFSDQVLSSEIKEKVAKGFVMRPLELGDFDKGFLSVLAQLSHVGDVKYDDFVRRFFQMRDAKCYYVVVIEHTQTQKIVATATVFHEMNFLRKCSSVAHIENVVVDKGVREQAFGKVLVHQLKYIAEQFGAYKIILDCAERNVKFYENCGFQKKELQMAFYFPSYFAKL